MTTSTAQAEQQARNRRESYRINDKVALAVRPLNESEYRAARGAGRAEHDRRRILNSIIAEGENQRGALRNIRDAEPAIATYLQGLEDRLEALARLLSREQHAAPQKPTHEVNISGTGIRFVHNEKLVRGSYMHLSLQLFPSRTCLGLLARVVRCQELERPTRDGGRFVLAADFSDIHADDQELLIRHVHALQLEQARRGLLRR